MSLKPTVAASEGGDSPTKHYQKLNSLVARILVVSGWLYVLCALLMIGGPICVFIVGIALGYGDIRAFASEEVRFMAVGPFFAVNAAICMQSRRAIRQARRYGLAMGLVAVACQIATLVVRSLLGRGALHFDVFALGVLGCCGVLLCGLSILGLRGMVGRET